MNDTDNEVPSFKPGNPFAEKAIRYMKKHLALNRPTARDEAMKNSFPLGGGFGHGSMRSREKSIDASVRRAGEAVRVRNNAVYWTALAEAYDRGEVNAQGRSVNSGAEKGFEASCNDMIMRTVKVGDMIDIGGNTPLVVAKVNTKSVVTVDGGKWMVSEIARVIPADVTTGIADVEVENDR